MVTVGTVTQLKNESAGNGMMIAAQVVLVDEVGTQCCWRAEIRVDDQLMTFSHHHEFDSAEQWALKMHGVYLGIHAN